MCKVLVEVNQIQVKLELMMNKVFYARLSLMMMVSMLVKMMVMMVVVILMIIKISHELCMFEAINIFVLCFF